MSLRHGKILPEIGAMKLKTISREEQQGKLRKGYGGCGAEGKSRILDELCEHYGYQCRAHRSI